MVFDVNQYSSTGKVHFRKILSVTLTFEPVTLKMSSLLCGRGIE